MDAILAQSVLEVVDAPIITLDPLGRVHFFGRGAERLFGCSSEDAEGKYFWDLVASAEQRGAVAQDFEVLLDSKHERRCEYDWVDPAGRVRRIAWHLACLNGAGGEVTHVVAAGLDVTDLHDSEARYRWLSAATIEGITHHEKGIIVDVNLRCAEIFGYTVEEMIGTSVLRFATPESGEIIMGRIRAGLEGGYEVVGVRKDGSTFPLEIVIRTSTFKDRELRIAGLRDISERKRLEREQQEAEKNLHRAQRLETVAVLAGGIAHDFNNLLTVILNSGQFALQDEGMGVEARRDIEKVLSAAEVAARLTSQLLIFSRPQPIDAEPMSVNDTIEEFGEIIEGTLREDIAYQKVLSKELWEAKLEGSAFEQILLNLAINARDAMPLGGCFRVETENLSAHEPLRVSAGTLPAGDYVVVKVSDDGAGMSAELASRVFEPFFTTKRTSGHSGLGLAVVYGLVSAAKGGIRIESKPDGGTTFWLYLPRHRDGKDTAPEVAAEPAPTTILVVEDQPLVLEVMVRHLVRAGYNVLFSHKPEVALELARDYQGTIDLMVSDVIMPVLAGPELVDKVRTHHPDMIVIYVSGHPADVLSKRGIAKESLLNKPFTGKELVARIKTTLASTTTPHSG